MKYYLSIDGGGSKLFSILFTDELKLIKIAISKGVNTTQSNYENIVENIHQCLNEVFAGTGIRQVDTVYASLVGEYGTFRKVMQEYASVGEYVPIGEPCACLLAGRFTEEGIVAQAGTGSDAFLLVKDTNEQIKTYTCGGWGPVLGDQGSGAWIGQYALREIVRAMEGWGEKTIMTDFIREEWKLQKDYDLVKCIHEQGNPFARIASVTYIVSKAAKEGDLLALRILEEAGVAMAQQVECLLARPECRNEEKEVLCSGGSWKIHKCMMESFGNGLKNGRYPVFPKFEPATAGIVLHAREKQWENRTMESYLQQEFADCIWKR